MLNWKIGCERCWNTIDGELCLECSGCGSSGARERFLCLRLKNWPELLPGDVSAQLNLGHALQNQGKFEESRVYLPPGAANQA